MPAAEKRTQIGQEPHGYGPPLEYTGSYLTHGLEGDWRGGLKLSNGAVESFVSKLELEIQEPDRSKGVGALIEYNRRLRDQIADLTNSHRQDIRDFESKLRELSIESDRREKSFQSEALAWQKERQELQAEKELACQKLEKEKEELRSQIQALSLKLKSLAAGHEQLQKKLAASENRGNSLEKLKSSLVNQARDVKSDLAELKSTCAEQESAIEDLLSERDELLQRLEAFKDSNRQIQLLEDEKAKLAHLLEEKSANLDAATSKLAELATQLANSELQRKELKEQGDATAEALGIQKETVASLAVERDQLVAKLQALATSAQRIASLEQENAELKAEMEKQADDVAVSRRYIAEAEHRMAENERLKALAEQKTKDAAEALKKQEQAEKEAFESRRKLLDSYTEQESQEIVLDNLKKAQEEIESLKQQIEETKAEVRAARADAADWERKYEKLEHDTLYSSSRESLRASLGRLAERRSGDK